MPEIHNEYTVKNLNKEGSYRATLEPKAKGKISNTDPVFS